jgi:DNA-binding NarL/FixJ family response regulator
MTRVGVIDDHPVVWRAVQAATRAEPDLQYVGHGSEASDLEGLLAELPDILLVDVRLGSEDGLELCERALHLCPRLRIIVFTAYGTPSLLVRALNSGAVGYILKDADVPNLLHAIRLVRDHGSYVDPRLAAGALGVGRRSEAPLLTPRETDVLALIVKGATNREIAADLVLSPHTVKYHVENIKAKLGARRRTELVRLAAERMLM